MRKNLLNALAIGAGLAMGASAMADLVDGVEVVQPTVGNEEFGGPSTFITINIPAGQAAANRITDATELRAFLVSIDSNGDPVAAIEVSAGIVGAPVNYNDGAGNAGVEIDLTNAAGTTAFFNAANAAGNMIQIVVNTTDIAGASNNGIQTAFDGADEANDENLDPDPVRPALQNVFITTDGLTTYFVFAESLNNGAAGNDDNHTVIANLDANGADFQVNTTNSFDGTQLAAAGLSGPGFLAGSDNTVLEYTRDPNAANVLSNGNFVRPFFDNNGDPQNAIFDIVGNQATNGAVQVAPLTPLQITSVEFVESVTGGGVFANAVRVTYNLPLDPADLGNPVFYGAQLQLPDGASDIDITGALIDPDNSSAVLLSLFANGTDLVFSDGLSADGEAYSIETDLGGNVPSSIFDTDDYATAQDVTGDDAIAPTLVGRSFHDLNGDGKQDAVAFVFGETIADTTADSGITLTVIDGQVMTPFGAIDMSTGALVEVETDVDASPDDEIEDFEVSVLTVEAPGVPDGRTNNAVVLSFDPDLFPFDGTAGNDNVPGTGDSGIFNLAYDADATGAEIEDANGNAAATIAAGAATVDQAAPVVALAFFYTGDNQMPVDDGLFNANNSQFAAEQDDTLGDQDANNRATLYFSEAVDNNAANTIMPSTVTYGPSFTAFLDNDDVGGDFIGFDNPDGANNNGVIFNLRETAEQGEDTSGLQPGVQVTIDSGSNIEDAGGNEALVDGAILENRTAPYVALQADVNDNEFAGAYLVDDTGNGLVNRILLVFTEPIDPATLDDADFETSRGVIQSVGLDSADGTQRTVEIVITGTVSINSTVTVTYNGDADAAQLITSDETAGGLGNAVDDVTTVFANVEELQSPIYDTDSVAIQAVQGTVTINGQPVQQGTKVFASVAVPTVYQVEATHNNVFFQYRRNDEVTYASLTESESLDEWTSWLLGVFPDLYLARTGDNEQIFNRVKDVSDDVPGTVVLGDTIRLTISAATLTNITFQGTGETATDRVIGGRARLAWDLLRSSDGRLGSFFREGYTAGGVPIVSSAVIDNADGAYSMHVSAPISAFNGISRFNSINWPIIIWVELPNGTRHVVSSLLTSVNGASVKFNPANRTQSSGNAPDAIVFNINLDNVGVERVFDGWNTIPFGRVSGWAQAQGNVPTRPDGIPAPVANDPSSVLQTGSTLPAVGPLEQWVWFNDANNDGVWDRTDDAGTRFGDLIIDSKFIPNFAFTMTSLGVQAGSSINNLIGGYALGFFSKNPGGTPLGVFQFGAPLDQPAFFTTNSFPNNTTTQGWALLTRSQAGDVTSGVGSRVDYVIWFNNRGNGIEVASLDVQNPSGTNNPNDLGDIDAADIPAALFVHQTP
ncbi:MAG: hypothetical protein ACTS3F_12830 [Phycisphaerales bacterium]